MKFIFPHISSPGHRIVKILVSTPHNIPLIMGDTELEKAARAARGACGHFLPGLRTFCPGNHALLSRFCTNGKETWTVLRTMVCRLRI